MAQDQASLIRSLPFRVKMHCHSGPDAAMSGTTTYPMSEHSGPDAAMSGTTTDPMSELPTERPCVFCGPRDNLDAERDTHKMYVSEESGWVNTYKVLVCLKCQDSLGRQSNRDVSRDDWEEIDPRMRRDNRNDEYWQLVKQRTLSCINQKDALDRVVVKMEVNSQHCGKGPVCSFECESDVQILNAKAIQRGPCEATNTVKSFIHFIHYFPPGPRPGVQDVRGDLWARPRHPAGQLLFL